MKAVYYALVIFFLYLVLTDKYSYSPQSENTYSISDPATPAIEQAPVPMQMVRDRSSHYNHARLGPKYIKVGEAIYVYTGFNRTGVRKDEKTGKLIYDFPHPQLQRRTKMIIPFQRVSPFHQMHSCTKKQ